MYSREFEYTDYNGNPRKETHYFNLNETECAKLEMSKQGGLTAYINRIIDAQDLPELSKLWDEVLDMAYCRKSDDGYRLIKSPQISKEFKETEAYNILFMELITDADKAAKFMNTITPQKKQDVAPVNR